MVKIALLTLAYRANDVLSKFATNFDDERFEFYVHVDSKLTIRAYQKDQPFPRCHFINDRHSIFWGGFNMIRATLSLARAALADPENEWFALISDDTYPLFPAKELYHQIIGGGDRLNYWLLKPENLNYRRYWNFYFFDSDQSSAQHRAAEMRAVSSSDLEAYIRLHSLMLRGKFNIQLYGGSQWWVMSRDALEKCLQIAASNQHLTESFEFSAIPDESFFQTIYKSAFIGGGSKSSRPVYADFERNPKPFVFRSLSELNNIVILDYLFIRKVHFNPEFLDDLIKYGQAHGEKNVNPG